MTCKCQFCDGRVGEEEGKDVDNSFPQEFLDSLDIEPYRVVCFDCAKRIQADRQVDQQTQTTVQDEQILWKTVTLEWF